MIDLWRALLVGIVAIVVWEAMHRRTQVPRTQEPKIDPRVAELQREVEALRQIPKAVPVTIPAPKLDPEEIDITSRTREMLLDALERSATPIAQAASTTVVVLPSEDLKGRIVGREGRNMRAFEQVTGVDLLIDETPGAVTLSSFDPMRREIARITLERLIEDGKIQPSRIEEVHAQAAAKVEQEMGLAGIEAADFAGVKGLPKPITQALGRLKYRTSYAQNVLEHSVETARIAGILAAELGLDPANARRGALLHDIGKALGPEWEGPHAIAGMRFLKSHGEREPVLNAVGAHHREIPPDCPEAQLVIVADGLSASRPGARREALEDLLQRQAKLEEISMSFPGVAKSYAVQSGRELRVLVNPGAIDDAGAVQLASDIARKIQEEVHFPGQIKVTVIRELRAEQVAG